MEIKRACIVGGGGRMGSWLASLMEKGGMDVERLDKDKARSPEEVVPLCDITVISVPMDVTVSVIRSVAPLVPSGAVLADLTSVKFFAMKAMLESSESEVVGIHPLFGPQDEPLGSRIALCPGRGDSGLAWLESFFINNGYNVSRIEAEEHDRLMAIVQGVNHFSTLALALCMAESRCRLEDLSEFATRGFAGRIERIREMLRQSPGLFFSIFTENRFSLDAFDDFRSAAKKLTELVTKGDYPLFEGVWESLKEFFNEKEK